jgi:hypothetical protein
VRRTLCAFIVACLTGAFFAVPATPAKSSGRAGEGGIGDATVVAVLDSGLEPYHWDFLASKMPQATDGDPSNDLPLDRPPHTWIPGFPSPGKAFNSYGRLDLTLEEKDPEAPVASLAAKDAETWAGIKRSRPKKLRYYWIPDTKVIGTMTFNDDPESLKGEPNSHGVGTTSASVGNLHGTCPECLLLFINLGSREDSEAAIEWAMSQPWIDAITNSYGYSLAYRDRFYSGSNVKAQRKASLRGQTVFFSAGNGQANTFTVPNATLLSSQEGPDWIVTVGAISPGEDNYYGDPLATSHHASYSGHGKPADIASIGLDYPSAYTSATVGGTGTSGFSGTSSSTPTIAGIYARALWTARRAMRGNSKVQRKGIVSTGRFECGKARPRCELGDGSLTARELRTRLFEGAIHTEAGMTVSFVTPGLPPIGEDEFLNEGHGSYFGRETGKLKDYLKEFQRVVGPMMGTMMPLPRPEGERDWMIVDSFCRQHIWGPWTGGYYLEDKTELPGYDESYPARYLIQSTCPGLQPPP